jgi:hypothetical protein
MSRYRVSSTRYPPAENPDIMCPDSRYRENTRYRDCQESRGGFVLTCTSTYSVCTGTNIFEGSLVSSRVSGFQMAARGRGPHSGLGSLALAGRARHRVGPTSHGMPVSLVRFLKGRRFAGFSWNGFCARDIFKLSEAKWRELPRPLSETLLTTCRSALQCQCSRSGTLKC